MNKSVLQKQWNQMNFHHNLQAICAAKWLATLLGGLAGQLGSQLVGQLAG